MKDVNIIKLYMKLREAKTHVSFLKEGYAKSSIEQIVNDCLYLLENDPENIMPPMSLYKDEGEE